MTNEQVGLQEAAAPSAASVAAGSGRGSEPALPLLVIIFWATFAAAAAFLQFSNPDIFARTDPDSVLRLVQVRDLLGGQAWFDLVQHRMNPPAGVLMHWSRLIDAPLAGLVLLGNALALNGETVALTFWPLLMLLGFMAACTYAAVVLAGRGAALPALLMSLAFYNPLVMFLPGDVDHHNAQIALTLTALAAALRMRDGPIHGLVAGLTLSLMLAIGLETLPFIVIIGTVVAVGWAFTGQRSRGTALFGAALAIAPIALEVLTGSPAANTACDTLSWTYALPAGVAGGGLAALTLLPDNIGWRARTLVLLGIAVLAGGTFLLMAPECRFGPYGMLSAEYNALIMSKTSEAQPLFATFGTEPANVVASILAPLIALALAVRFVFAAPSAQRAGWALAASLIAAAVGISLYQWRGVPSANALAIPVLAAWVAKIAAHRGVTSLCPIGRSWPVVAAFVLCMPFVHLGLGLLAAGAVTPSGRAEATAGKPASHALASLPKQECSDASAAAVLSSVPKGVVLAPLSYGPTVLALSQHLVVAGPYHRAERAAVDTMRAMAATPEDALGIVRAHAVDYVAVCSTANEVRRAVAGVQDGLLSSLVAGREVGWLKPLARSSETGLQLFLVSR